MQDNKKVIKKILFGTEQPTITDNKIMLVNVKFSLNACKNLTKNELDNLSDTARNFFYFVQSFENKLKICNFVNLWVVEDRIQDLDTVTQGIFQMYFMTTCLIRTKTAKNKTKLNKKTIEILLNKLFVLDDQQQNEKTINEYSNEHDITVK